MGKGAAAASGVGVGIVLVWAWNGYLYLNGLGPEMPGEVAAAIAVGLNRLLDRVETR